MNYLAHCCLVPEQADWLAGAILGDVVHGRDLSAWPEAVQRSIRLHRQVDSFTDAHPDVRALRQALPPPLRRYGGILIDVVFDHLLAGDFSRHDGRDLPEFAGRCYQALRGVLPALDADGQRKVAYILDHDLLVQYRHWTVVVAGLRGISRRLHHANPLADAAASLLPMLPQFEHAFAAFWPALRSFAERQIAASVCEQDAPTTG